MVAAGGRFQYLTARGGAARADHSGSLPASRSSMHRVYVLTASCRGGRGGGADRGWFGAAVVVVGEEDGKGRREKEARRRSPVSLCPDARISPPPSTLPRCGRGEGTPSKPGRRRWRRCPGPPSPDRGRRGPACGARERSSGASARSRPPPAESESSGDRAPGGRRGGGGGGGGGGGAGGGGRGGGGGGGGGAGEWARGRRPVGDGPPPRPRGERVSP